MEEALPHSHVLVRAEGRSYPVRLRGGGLGIAADMAGCVERPCGNSRPTDRPRGCAKCRPGHTDTRTRAGPRPHSEGRNQEHPRSTAPPGPASAPHSGGVPALRDVVKTRVRHLVPVRLLPSIAHSLLRAESRSTRPVRRAPRRLLSRSRWLK